MTTSKGNKKVRISKDGTGTYRVCFIQIYNGEEQLLQMKDYSTLSGAKKWGDKMLNK